MMQLIAQAPAPKAAPAPKKAAAKKGAAAPAASMGFSGVPADFARPEVNCPSGFAAADETQTVKCISWCPILYAASSATTS